MLPAPNERDKQILHIPRLVNHVRIGEVIGEIAQSLQRVIPVNIALMRGFARVIGAPIRLDNQPVADKEVRAKNSLYPDLCPDRQTQSLQPEPKQRLKTRLCVRIKSIENPTADTASHFKNGTAVVRVNDSHSNCAV